MGDWGNPGHHCGAGATPGLGSVTSTPELGMSTRSIHTLLASSTTGRQDTPQCPRDRGSLLQGTSGWPLAVVVRPAGHSAGCPMKQNTGAHLLSTRFLVASIPGST